MPTMIDGSANKRAAAQARYRERLRHVGPTASGPAPETRTVTQAIAAAVRGLAGSVNRSEDRASAETQAVQSILTSAHRRLVDGGYDRAEAGRRLLLYVREADPERRRRRSS